MDGNFANGASMASQDARNLPIPGDSSWPGPSAVIDRIGAGWFERLLPSPQFAGAAVASRPFCDIRCAELDALQRTLNELS
jgi:hypothetical protein